ncbi:MAG: amino acid permease [Bacteroidales bacterium]|nr:amino acid permease [Bacteroidales bacterium]
MKGKIGFGTMPVFLTAISTILGAILFLRFGYAVGSVGFMGTLLIIIVGHMVTIPTALSLSEIATNQKVEGGGEYFIVSRSFGLNIGATIGIALYLSQAISVAFYIIAFTESFEPVFTRVNSWSSEALGFEFPRQLISVPAMFGLSVLILRKGATMGVKALYFVVAILALSLFLFFIGDTGYVPEENSGVFSFQAGNIKENFFIVFAVIFPAFTGMTAGVGLSGDLRDPSKSIPLGTTTATIFGMFVYILIAYKLTISASMEELSSDYYIMRKIAVFGFLVVPLGLAASTLSSAIGSILVAPRTLQALAVDNSIPIKPLNKILAKGRGKNNEPYFATIVTSIIAMCFVILGEVDTVARIISMFFMVTYGSLCLISFLYHFGADPSYRPSFRSKWYVSLVGFVLCVWLMFKMDRAYANVAILSMVVLYFIVSNKHKERGGMQELFKGVVFQLSRKMQIYIQKNTRVNKDEKWRPSVVCISGDTFERDKVLRLLDWISDKYGFGTYIHLIEDYFSRASHQKSDEIHARLLERIGKKSNIYIDTLISPSYTSAIAQTIQLPGISGMPNNMFLFEFDKQNPVDLPQIAENLTLIKAANLDIAILASTSRKINFNKGIHVWIKNTDFENSNLMILLSYIIISHHEWKNSRIRIFEIAPQGKHDEYKARLLEIISEGRLPISPANVEIIESNPDVSIRKIISQKSVDAGLTLIGFHEDQIKRSASQLVEGYELMGDILFVNASTHKNID